MSNRKSYDIIIVGAGMVGAALACKLIKDNPALSLALIETATFSPAYNDTKFDPRVVALTKASQALLQTIEVWEQIEQKRVCHYKKMEVWDGTGTGSIEFDCKEVNEPSLGAIAENSIIVEALLEKISKSSIDFLCPETVSTINLSTDKEKAMVVLESGHSLEASMLIATDGANSRLRKLANLSTREWSYGQTAIVCTVEMEFTHQQVARQCFTSHGPVAFLPLKAKDGTINHCSIVWSVQSDYAAVLLGMSDSEFCKTLAYNFEHRLGNIISITKRASFPLAQRHCKNYFKNGLVVAGDAAHTIHPLAGQGVNLGFEDAIVLAEEIARAQARNIPLTDISILQRYQRRRKGANLTMMGIMEGFKQTFSQTGLIPIWLRNEGMKKINKLSPIKNKIIKEAMGL